MLWLYQDYRTDAFRQKMFNLRDDLFDEARHGKIDFDEGNVWYVEKCNKWFYSFWTQV